MIDKGLGVCWVDIVGPSNQNKAGDLYMLHIHLYTSTWKTTWRFKLKSDTSVREWVRESVWKRQREREQESISGILALLLARVNDSPTLETVSQCIDVAPVLWSQVSCPILPVQPWKQVRDGVQLHSKASTKEKSQSIRVQQVINKGHVSELLKWWWLFCTADHFFAQKQNVGRTSTYKYQTIHTSVRMPPVGALFPSAPLSRLGHAQRVPMIGRFSIRRMPWAAPIRRQTAPIS